MLVGSKWATRCVVVVVYRCVHNHTNEALFGNTFEKSRLALSVRATWLVGNNDRLLGVTFFSHTSGLTLLQGIA